MVSTRERQEMSSNADRFVADVERERQDRLMDRRSGEAWAKLRKSGSTLMDLSVAELVAVRRDVADTLDYHGVRPGDDQIFLCDRCGQPYHESKGWRGLCARCTEQA